MKKFPSVESGTPMKLRQTLTSFGLDKRVEIDPASYDQ